MRIKLQAGETLWKALEKQGIHIDRPCQGRGICGGCKVHILGIGEVLACSFVTPGTYEVSLPQQISFDTIFWPNNKQEPHPLLSLDDAVAAIDLGTTTIALAFYVKGTQRFYSFVNPQRSYGADVLSRIEACTNDAAVAQTLQRMVRQRLLSCLDALLDEFGLSHCRIAISGNTTMLHILRGFSCKGLGHAPFFPTTLGYGLERWDGLCTDATHSYTVEFLPGISTFVGADIVGGIHHCGIHRSEKPCLLLDLGTNGEMVLGNRHRLLCASAAAGPAFEGTPPSMFLHASGILRLMHQMLDEQIIDEMGILQPPYEEGFPIPDAPAKLCITQADIQDIQLAKAAIRAGIDSLLCAYQITASEVERVYIAGGMGYYLNPKDAIALGLFPAAFADKCESVGNTSLLGCLSLLEHPQNLSVLSHIATHTEELLLSCTVDFEERFLASINF